MKFHIVQQTFPHQKPMTNKSTESEVLETQNLNLFLIDKLLNQGAFELEDIGDYVPSFLHLNNEHDLTIEYMNKTGCDWLELTSVEINDMGYDFFEKYIDDESLRLVVPRVMEFYHNNDRSKVYCDFQRVLNPRTQKYNLLFLVTKICNKRPGLLTISQPLENSTSIVKKLERVLGEQRFARKHFKLFSTLTKREVQILTLLADGCSNPQIADQLFLSRRTVEQHRKNINRKLEIKHFADLIKYAQAFDLV